MDYEEIVVSKSANPKLIKEQSPPSYNQLAYTEESIDDMGSPKPDSDTRRSSLATSDDKAETKNIELLSPNVQDITPDKPCSNLSPGEVSTVLSLDIEQA